MSSTNGSSTSTAPLNSALSTADMLVQTVEALPSHYSDEVAMIDVHPPHTAIAGWRDFFVHIATIVIGLLIAVGLEQTVEWLHHRHQIMEVRSSIAEERQANASVSVVLVEEYRRVGIQLANNRAVFVYLRDHPGAPASEWPAQISWRSLTVANLKSAWITAQSSGVLPQMPHEEVQQLTELYSRLDEADSSFDTFLEAIFRARRYTFLNTDVSRMTPLQIDAQLDRLGDVLSAHARRGQVLAALALRFPDFTGPTKEDLAKFTLVAEDDAQIREVRRLFDKVQAIKDQARCVGCR